MIFCQCSVWDSDKISAIASSVGALISGFAFCAAWYQIKKLNRRNEYDTYNQVKKDIDSDFVRNLIKAIQDSTIEIVPYTPSIPDPSKTYIIERDLTSKFLDHLEDLYVFYSKNLISIDIIEAGFSRKILVVGNNPKVEAYIDNLRTVEKDNAIYGGFHELYKAVYNKLAKHQRSDFRKDIL